MESKQPFEKYVSEYGFQATHKNEMSFVEGEEFQILEKHKCWWRAAKLDTSGRRTGEVGLIPSNCLRKNTTDEQQIWYIDIEDSAAEELLLFPPNTHGCFLVRPSKTNAGDYVLSVRDIDEVKHFLIKKNTKGELVMNDNLTFSSLIDLVDFFTADWKLLNCPLIQPFIRLINQKLQVESVTTEENMESKQPLEKYVSEYDYQAADEDEMSFVEGEEFQILEQYDGWCRAAKLDKSGSRTGETGLIPSNYLRKKTMDEQQTWYIDIEDSEAEELLLFPPNTHGSFLVRPSKTNTGDYVLSVRNIDKVKHVLIKKNATGKLVMNDDLTFSSLIDLVDFFTADWKLLNCPLIQPLIRPRNQKVQEDDPWERPWSDFILEKKKKTNFHFGEVWEGRWNEAKRKVLIYTINQNHFKENGFKEGIDIMKNLDHSNVTNLLAVSTTEDKFCVVTEFMAHGNLDDYLCGEVGPQLAISDLLNISRQVVDGMAYLEVKRVVHRDLAARNILVGENLTCKIGHFGLARQLKTQYGNYSPNGISTVPVKWTALEILQNGVFSIKSDVWSFGILLYEIFTLGQKPYKGVHIDDVLGKLSSGYRLPIPHCAVLMCTT